jgi:membrane-bound serine protease (ClpP class)
MNPTRPLILILCALVAVVGFVGGAAAQSAAGDGSVRVIEVEGSIDPVLADWFGSRIDSAEAAGAEAVIVRVDTPGGLAMSMDAMVARIAGSDVPVAVWVGPSGARAGSAGAYIAASAPFLLMAPGTNIGSATPVGIGGQDLDAKVINDAAASIAALAESNGRNADAYRSMVTEAANFTAQEAVDQDVADALAATLDEVLTYLDGRPDGSGAEMETLGAPVQTDSLPWYLQALQVLIDPNLVFLLLLLGLLGMVTEVMNPGGIIPGAAGLMAFLVGVAGLAMLPFNWVGLALIVVGVGLLFAETQVPGFGALAAAGIVALCLGGVFLFGSGDDGIATSPWVVIPVGVIVGGGAVIAGRRIVKAHRNRPSTGADTMVGLDAVARTVVDAGSGTVTVNGELWAARSAEGDRHDVGAPLRVTRVDSENFIVMVEPRPPKEE